MSFSLGMVAALCFGLAAFMLYRPANPNWWIGVRIPWTYADPEIWRQSWRLAAIMLLNMGIGALLAWWLFVVFFISFLVACFYVPMRTYRRKYGTLRFWKDAGWLDYQPVALCPQCGHYQKLASAAAFTEAACEACGQPFPAAR
ncbi:MAG: SdpI family protein [Thermodesulfobacteriota bacterium]